MLQPGDALAVTAESGVRVGQLHRHGAVVVAHGRLDAAHPARQSGDGAMALELLEIHGHGLDPGGAECGVTQQQRLERIDEHAIVGADLQGVQRSGRGGTVDQGLQQAMGPRFKQGGKHHTFSAGSAQGQRTASC